MIRMLIRLAIYFLSALVGVLAATLILSGFKVSGPLAYIEVGVIYAVIQAILSPMVERGVRRNAGAFSGGVGLLSTFVALLITDLISSGLDIDGASTWILGTLIVWLFTAIAAFLLPFILVKRAVEDRRG